MNLNPCAEIEIGEHYDKQSREILGEYFMRPQKLEFKADETFVEVSGKATLEF